MSYTGTLTITDPGLVETINDLPEGYTGYVRVDEDAYGDSPRDWAPNVATIIQRNDRRGAVDEPDARLDEARDRWSWTKYASLVGGNRSDRAIKAVGDEGMVARYLSIFRPDIALYVDHWSAGRDLFGWGYITAEAWEEGGYTIAPQDVFDQEVEIFRQWADGEVYGVTVVNDETGEDASLWSVYDSPGYFREVALDLIEECK